MNYILAIAFLLPSLAYAAKPVLPVNDRIDEFKSKMSVEKIEIRALTKTNECIADGECDSIELGESRCGGPTAFVVFSTNNGNLASIKAHAGNYTAAEKGLNALSTDSVDCNPPRVPEPKCVKQKCVDVVRSKAVIGD